MATKKFELTDLASGKKTELPVKSGTIGPDVVDIAAVNKDHGVFTFDPGFMATASTESKITYIDGDEGVLLYRGYPIEQLAQHSSFLEVAYLLLNGELPNPKQLAEFTTNIQRHTMINESLLRMYNGFHYDAHPMAMLCASVASLSAFYHDNLDMDDPEQRRLAAIRLSDKGMVRWYASCCGTPMGNTMANPKMSFIGLVHTCLDQGRMDEDFGTNVAVVNTDTALGNPKPKQRGLLGVVARFLWIVVASRISGRYRKSPLFNGSGLPQVAPKILPAEELANLKSAISPFH